MSRSTATSTNPVQRRYQWKGLEGKLIYWDKEQGKEVEVKLPFSFLVLDELATIGGWSDEDRSSYWSNEVRRVAHEELRVRTNKGEVETGLYKDLKCRAKGAKYAKSIYISVEGRIHHIKAVGAFLSQWIDLTQEHKIFKTKVTLTGGEERKKGATTFYTPVFEVSDPTSVEESKALELNNELQDYLGQHLSYGNFSRGEQSMENEARQLQKEAEEEFVPLDIDEPTKMEDIPF